MEKTLFNKCLKNLEPKQEEEISSWLATIAGGGSTKNTGENVVNNMKRECALSEADFESFLRDLAGNLRRESDPVTAFKKTCDAFLCRGREAKTQNCKLFRVVNEEDFKRYLASSMGEPPGDRDRVYDVFMNDYTDEQRRDILAGYAMTRPGGVVWATFPEDGTGDPFTNLSAQRIRERLGLDPALYKPGIPMVKIVYFPMSFHRVDTSSEDPITRHVPTVADAGWNAYWQAPESDAKHGVTRDLSGGNEGMPEIVHENVFYTAMIESRPDKIEE